MFCRCGAEAMYSPSIPSEPSPGHMPLPVSPELAARMHIWVAAPVQEGSDGSATTPVAARWADHDWA